MNVWMRPVSCKGRAERDVYGESILRRIQENTSSEWSLIGSGDAVIVLMKWLWQSEMEQGCGGKRGGTAIS